MWLACTSYLVGVEESAVTSRCMHVQVKNTDLDRNFSANLLVLVWDSLRLAPTIENSLGLKSLAS